MKEGLKSIIKWIVRGALYIWFKVIYQVKIIGLENIPKDRTINILWKS